jgi:hypothetical protein
MKASQPLIKTSIAEKGVTIDVRAEPIAAITEETDMYPTPTPTPTPTPKLS